MAGWKPALRLARRDALRNKGRSVLVLVMIALPVLAVSAAEVVYQTSDVAGAESLDRRLGSADARVVVSPGSGRVIQGFDPDRDPSGSLEDNGDQPPVTLEGVRAALGRDVPATERRDGGVRVDTERRPQRRGHRARPRVPLVDGLFRLTDGRWPAASTEVVVNEALAEKGFAAGSVPSTTADPDRGRDGRVDDAATRCLPRDARRAERLVPLELPAYFLQIRGSAGPGRGRRRLARPDGPDGPDRRAAARRG